MVARDSPGWPRPRAVRGSRRGRQARPALGQGAAVVPRLRPPVAVGIEHGSSRSYARHEPACARASAPSRSHRSAARRDCSRCRRRACGGHRWGSGWRYASGCREFDEAAEGVTGELPQQTALSRASQPALRTARRGCSAKVLNGDAVSVSEAARTVRQLRRRRASAAFGPPPNAPEIIACPSGV